MDSLPKANFFMVYFLSITYNLVKNRSKSCKRSFWMPHYLEGLGKYVVDGGLKMYRTLSPARHISCKKLKQNFSWIFWLKKIWEINNFFLSKNCVTKWIWSFWSNQLWRAFWKGNFYLVKISGFLSLFLGTKNILLRPPKMQLKIVVQISKIVINTLEKV